MKEQQIKRLSFNNEKCEKCGNNYLEQDENGFTFIGDKNGITGVSTRWECPECNAEWFIHFNLTEIEAWV